jgi:hypothetical protein
MEVDKEKICTYNISVGVACGFVGYMWACSLDAFRYTSANRGGSVLILILLRFFSWVCKLNYLLVQKILTETLYVMLSPLTTVVNLFSFQFSLDRRKKSQNLYGFLCLPAQSGCFITSDD